jgi:predicted nucleic acid-binding protein
VTETLVIDASIAIKWVIEENGSNEAVALRATHRFVAPDLLNAECANILWKKVRRGELVEDEARLAASLLMQADVEMTATRPLLVPAMELALRLDHPAYDCIYLALAMQRRLQFVTADERLIATARRSGVAGLGDLCVTPEDLG